MPKNDAVFCEQSCLVCVQILKFNSQNFYVRRGKIVLSWLCRDYKTWHF